MIETAIWLIVGALWVGVIVNIYSQTYQTKQAWKSRSVTMRAIREIADGYESAVGELKDEMERNLKEISVSFELSVVELRKMVKDWLEEK